MGVQPLDEETRLLGASMEVGLCRDRAPCLHNPQHRGYSAWHLWRFTMQVEAIPRASDVARQRIQEEVLNPMAQWMTMYKQDLVRRRRGHWGTTAAPRPGMPRLSVPAAIARAS